VTVNVGVGVVVGKTIGVIVKELDRVVVTTSGLVGRGFRGISGRKEVNEPSLLVVGVVLGKTTGCWVRVVDRAGAFTSGVVGMGNCALSGWKEVDEIIVPLIGV
jgi:hypothetical protein